jgi:hypothetical protein
MSQREVFVAFVVVVFGCAHATDTEFDANEQNTGGDASGAAGPSSGGQPGSGGFASPGSGGSSSGGAATSLGGSAQSGGQAGTAGNASGGAAATGGTNSASGGMPASGGTNAGSGGVSGSGGTPAEGLSVKYMVEESAANNTALGSQLWIDNTGTESVPLSELTVRYYFTNEVTASLVKDVNWGHMDHTGGGDYTDLAGNITIDVTSLSESTSSADSSVVLGFNAASATLKPGYRIKLSWRVQNFQSQQFNQSNDFSYNASLTSATDWDKVVLMRVATVVWGEEP